MFGQRQGVPPTFLAAAEFAVFPQVLHDPALDSTSPGCCTAAQSYELERPLREGETLTVRASIESVRVRGGTGFLVIAMRLDDEAGAPVARTRSTMIERAPA